MDELRIQEAIAYLGYDLQETVSPKKKKAYKTAISVLNERLTGHDPDDFYVNTLDTDKLSEILGYIEHIKTSGPGKAKSLELISNYIRHMQE